MGDWGRFGEMGEGGGGRGLGTDTGGRPLGSDAEYPLQPNVGQRPPLGSHEQNFPSNPFRARGPPGTFGTRGLPRPVRLATKRWPEAEKRGRGRKWCKTGAAEERNRHEVDATHAVAIPCNSQMSLLLHHLEMPHVCSLSLVMLL